MIGRDDVLTLLIHLGYLAYEEIDDGYWDDEEDEYGVVEYTGYARIPDKEVRDEFKKILRKIK